MQGFLGFFERLLGGKRRRYVEDFLRKAAASGDLDSITNAWYIYRSRCPAQLAHDAAATVAAIMERVSPAAWPKLYQQLRHLPATKTDMGRMAQLEGQAATHMLGLASLNTSGFVREEALRQLAVKRDPQGLPYVLLRLADWVPQVRAAAKEALAASLNAACVPVLLRHHLIIEHLRLVERADLSEELAALTALLLAPGARGQVLGVLDSPDAGQRLFAYRLLEQDPGTLPLLLDKAVRDASPAIRGWAVASVGREPKDSAARRLGTLMADADSRVRAAALRLAATDHWEHFAAQVRSRIFDNAGAVRCAAIYHLRQHGSTDVAELFRSRLRDGREVDIGVLAGLSEVGTAGDYELIEPYRGNRRARLRSAALSALGRLDRDRAAGPAIEALSDSSGRVRREATSLLMRLAPGGHLTEIRRAVREGPVRARTAGLRILALTGRWNVLGDLLEALADDDQEVVQAGWRALNHWSAEAWHAAAAEDVQRAQRALDAVTRKSPQQPEWSRVSLEGIRSKLVHLVATQQRP